MGDELITAGSENWLGFLVLVERVVCLLRSLSAKLDSYLWLGIAGLFLLVDTNNFYWTGASLESAQ